MFSEKLSLVPELPGSYQMKDKDGIIIYVGKAKNLKRRLSSYFNRTQTGKTKILVDNICDFEYIVTDSELESLILEITLIKKYNPKYNVLLKDDKSYPYIEYNVKPFPTLKIVRNIKLKKKRNNLYGPFPNSSSAKRIVNLLNRLYPLKKCDKLKKDYCLYYHLGECLGYCKNNIDKNKLDNMNKEIIDFLNGNSNQIKNKIKELMEIESSKLNFEKALEYKNLLNDINYVLEDQNIILESKSNYDLFNCYQQENYLSICTFFVRNGTLFGRSKKIINTLIDQEESLLEYIIKFYESNLIPKEIIVPEFIDQELLSDYLKTKVTTRKIGESKKLLDLAYTNSKLLLEEKIEELNRNEKNRLESLKELKDLLKLDKLSIIESFDNSHLFGTYYVGGMVSFKDFLPDKDNYRKFKLDSNIKDDYHAMKEVIYRRYFRLMMEEKDYPDLIVMDGGEQQVNACLEVLNELNINIPVCGLKKDSRHKTNILINSNLEEIEIDSKSNLFLYLSNIQEEVHRYAINYHRNIKNKGMLTSVLSDIPGLGDKRIKDLLRNFSSLKKIKESNVEELSKYIPKEVAENLLEYLKEE